MKRNQPSAVSYHGSIGSKHPVTVGIEIGCNKGSDIVQELVLQKMREVEDYVKMQKRKICHNLLILCFLLGMEQD